MARAELWEALQAMLGRTSVESFLRGGIPSRSVRAYPSSYIPIEPIWLLHLVENHQEDHMKTLENHVFWM